MPFEPYALPGLAEKLAAIGLVAVPNKLVTDYMREVERKDRTRGHWDEVFLPTDKLVHGLRSPQTLGRFGLGRWAAAPRRVRNLAAKVQENMPEDADFILGYFRSDPYLRVRIGGRSGESAYLAVWRNRFSLIAIAKRD